MRQRRWIVVVGLALVIGILALEPSAVPLLGSSSRPRLLFSDNFDGTTLDRARWNTYVTSRQANGHPWNDPKPEPLGNGIPKGCSYSAQYFLPRQVSVDNGLKLDGVADLHLGLV